ncbi:MAG: CDP-alcohol phosphatidyltransferase family protein [Candidatus Ventricola sp.]
MANALTLLRVLCSLCMAGTPALSPRFLALYVACGISDMLDGWVARRTGAASPLGARLDTLADMLFAAVSLIKILPALAVPAWLWVWMAVILVIKLVNLASGFAMLRRFVTEHTALNKAAGALLFALPLTLTIAEFRLSASVVCAVATLAAVQEGHYIRTGRIVE